MPAKLECIRLRGVRQNNLKGFDLDLPLGRYVVVTGLSGAGKSSLVFDTLHAEGQRRYVETFSAYTRQFLDLLDKPKVDSIENIRPSIAIEQTNTVKTSRSTVGTMTELTDFFKVWFSHVAECFDPVTGEKVEDDNPQTIWTKTVGAQRGRTVVVAFRVQKPENLTWTEILQNLKGQSYVRVLVADPASAAPPGLSSSNGSSRGKKRGDVAGGVPPGLSPSNGTPRIQGSEPAALLTAHRIDDLLASGKAALEKSLRAGFLFVAQDRVTLKDESKTRFLEATETALHFGKNEVHIFGEAVLDVGAVPPGLSRSTGSGQVQARTTESAHGSAATFSELGHYSRGLHSPKTGRSFRPATPALFSFNSPLGACPKCRGFGRVIEIDYRLAIPDQSLSIDQGAIKCWEGEVYRSSLDDLRLFAKKKKIPTNIPFAELTAEQQAFIVDGEPGYGEENGKSWPQYWYGVKGFFRWLEKTTYKMHVRVFLSRYRAYNPCPECHGQRLQPESLCWKWEGRTLPELYQLPVSELLGLVRTTGLPRGEPFDRIRPGGTPTTSNRSLASDAAASAPQSAIRNPQSAIDHPQSTDLAYDAILTRLRYLEQVGLGYLTLDRPSKTLSGGEVERVNLTSCLGTSLVDTLFVLDEPSVGLHARDIDRLIAIIRTLTDAGNTVVVVEHDEAMIRAADHVIEVGPEPGGRGGHIVFQGSVAEMLRSPDSITGAYFSGRETIPVPADRRPVANGTDGAERSGVAGKGGSAVAERSVGWLTFRGVTKHNLHDLSFRLPLRRLVCLSGVSGSGKSTLLDNVIYQGLLTQKHLITEDPAAIQRIASDLDFSEIVLVDQSPLSRTPRSNPALYTEAWDLIRELYSETPTAQAAGFSPSSFSFNSGDGRCDHCLGLGYERVEMQFLSDVFVPCPVCEGRRFKPEVLAIQWNGRSVADLLQTSVSDALPLFAEHPEIERRLASLADVGLGYLTLGQPLNTLSGGESQRLKLVRYLGTFASATSDAAPSTGALLLLDEPTTGLHRHDVRRLLTVLHALVDRGHSVVVIEHNLDVLKSADWIVEIGPEAGAGGGRVVAEGTPELVARENTVTSPFLREALQEIRAESADRELLAAEAPGEYQGTTANGGGRKAKGAKQQAALASATPQSALRNPQSLVLEGARENNLKNISLSIPHRQLNVVTGVSGSGKSTLAFDIVFAEGQRRFMESMSPYARQFVEQLPRPAIDRLTGIPPTVAIEQRVTRGSRKSTVATITEVAQYLRLLYARIGIQHHPDTDRPVTPLSEGALRQLLARTLETPAARKAKHLYLCAPLIRGRKGHHQPIATWIAKQGFELMRADGRLQRVDAFQKLDRYKEHDIEVVVADLVVPAKGKPANEINAALTRALQLGKGSCFLVTERGAVLSWFSTTRTDIETGESFPELDPKNFSFNSPRGWCPTCRGHGRVFPWMLEPSEDEADDPAARLREFGVESADEVAEQGQPCPECHGARLNRVGRAVKLHFRASVATGRTRNANAATAGYALSLPELLRSTPSQLLTHFRGLELDARGRAIVQDIVPQIAERLKFLDHVGLGYLSLDRPTETLSGGEAQRIRLAAQLGSNLSGVLYVLDEPSIGLHARDNDRLIETLQALRAKGNTLLVVEHDDELMERADRIIDLGPAAGIHGGEILANGTPAEIKASDRSITGLFLAKGIPHPLCGSYRAVDARALAPAPRRACDIKPKPAKSAKGAKPAPVEEEQLPLAPLPWLELTGARFRNLKGFDLRLPLGRLIMVAGPSGAGKSTLFRDLLHPAVAHAIKAEKPKLSGREFVKATGFADPDAVLDGSPTLPFELLRGATAFKRVIEVDQSPIGKTPRSTPATYLGIFDLIRQFFASLPESKIRGYGPGRFSFNTAGGRCPTCEGAGRIKLEMAFMPDTYLPCDDCHSSRYSPELADITWKGKNIGQVLELTFEEAAQFFDFHSQLSQVCQLMVECGLGYLTLGQSSPTLSGGEAQRLKLVTELSAGLASYRERSRGELPRNLYLLEEPTIGLHLSDCEKLIRVLHSLVDQGHSVVVIEHHLDLLAEADYLIELGPVGGPDGGELLYQGDLAGLLKVKNSPTAPYLKKLLSRKRPAEAVSGKQSA